MFSHMDRCKPFSNPPRVQIRLSYRTGFSRAGVLNFVSDQVKVYGEETDDLIRKIAELCSRRELDEWWEGEIGWSPDPHSVVSKARVRLDELSQRAKESGWQTKR
jgi:hypothetical protein